jgi:hypothetical protein
MQNKEIDMTNENQAANTVKRGRGRPRIHAFNNLNYVRTAGFRAGVLAFAAAVEPQADDTKLNALGRRFAEWHMNRFGSNCPAVPQKGNWLRNFSAFMNVLPLAEADGVFNMNVSDTETTQAEATLEENKTTATEVDQTDNTETTVDYTVLPPINLVDPEAPVRGAGGRFLSKNERQAMLAEQVAA